MAVTLGKFKKPAAAAGGAARAPAKRKSKYAGVDAATPRDPMPHVGDYCFRVIDCVEGQNPGTGTESFKISLEVVLCDDGNEFHKLGDSCIAVFLTSGKGGPSGLSRVKSFVMAAAGYESEDEYNAFDPDGLFIETITGAAGTEYADAGMGIAGRLVYCTVTRGKTIPDSTDYYREYAWGIVPEADQDQTARPEFAA